jgi:UDP-N-acetyl-D-mannosaminouronate:lipid I N-acetyl-D-mannosaminouronosyltransferase
VKFKIINGIKIYAPESRAELMQYAMDNNKTMVAINAEKILHANKEIRDFINRNIGYPDGIGAVWALKKKGIKSAVKIPGVELWLDLINSYYKTKSFYLIGGKQEVIEATVSKLKSEFKGITISNFRNGYIKTEVEELALIEDIIKHKPDIVFVGMGSPKQERLMEEVQKKHQAVYQGLGGSFDVYVGYVKRAPKWWIKNYLEWAYRLIKQPIRGRRQIHLVRFLINLFLKRY